MKILHVLYSGLGGHGNVFFSLVNADSDQEFKYEAIFNGIEAVKPEYIDLCLRYGIPCNYISKKPGLDLNYYRQLIRFIRKSDADIVFIHSSSNILPAKLGNFFSKKRKRIIVRETQANHLKVKREWVWLGFALLLAHKIVFLSEEYRVEIAKKMRWLYRSQKIAVIPNGIDLEMYKPGKRTTTGFIVIGMQSRLVKLKDHTTLLEAFSLLQNLNKDNGLTLLLKIAGDGDHKETLEKKAKELNLKKSVEFTGILNEKELLNFLWSLDIYVHASLGETMSTAIMQAMACRKPVIASDVPGISNMLVDKETGLLVPAKDPGALADAIHSLVKNAALAENIAERAYQFAISHYSNTAMFNRFKQIFIS